MEIEILNFSTKYTTDAPGWQQLLNIVKEYEYPIAIVPENTSCEKLLSEAATLAVNGDLSAALEKSNEIKEHLTVILEEFLEKNPSPKTKLIRESCVLKLNQNLNRLHTFLKYSTKTDGLNTGLRDSIQALATQTTAFFIAQCGLALKIMAQYVDAAKIIKTDNNYGASNPNFAHIMQNTGSLETIMEDGFTPFIGAGFGETKLGTISILKDNNTAQLIANAVNATIKEL